MFDTIHLLIVSFAIFGITAFLFGNLGKIATENKAHRAYCESIKGIPSLEGCVVDDKFVKLPEWMLEAGLVE